MPDRQIQLLVQIESSLRERARVHEIVLAEPFPYPSLSPSPS